MLRVCQIGVSGFGGTHYDMLLGHHERGAAEFLAATVINQAEEAEKCAFLRSIGCRIFTDYREMLARCGRSVDVCFIPTGIHLHAPMTIDALRAGANVYVEKPAAATIQDIRAMKDAERETGRFVAVGYQSMYGPDIMRMKKTIADGELGAVRTIKCRGLWPRSDAYYSRNNWAGRLRVNDHWVLDSPANNALAHYLNIICFLAGSVPEKSAALRSVGAELYRGNDIESADTACMRILTADDVPLYFFATHCSRETYGPEIVVSGERARMRWLLSGTLDIAYKDGRTESLATDGLDGVYERIFRALERRVAGERAFICDLDIARAQTLCVNGAHQSSPVRPVPREFLSREPCEESTRTIISGVDEAIDRAFREEKLFSQLDVPWAHRGKEFSLEGYEVFEGPAESDT